MKHLLSILAILILISLAKSSFSQEDRWEYVAYNDKSDFYIDKTTIQYNSTYNYVDCWVKSIPKESDYMDGKEIKNKMMKIRYYCGERKSEFLEAYTYFTDNTHTSPSGKNDVGKKDIIPETISEILYDYVCK